MKNDEASGVASISAELFKAVSLTPTILLTIFDEIWIFKNMPENSKTALIVKSVEKGDLYNCNNWMGITFFSLRGKGKQRKTCHGNSCKDHIFTHLWNRYGNGTAHNKETKQRVLMMSVPDS